MRFFFYGTLIDPEILRAVLQRSVDPIRRRKAVLKGYRRVYRRGASYPVIIADTTAQVQGIFVPALTTRDVALLTLYEGQEYEIRQHPVICASIGVIRANVFFPRPECEVSSESWTLEEWNRRFRRTFIRHVAQPTSKPGPFALACCLLRWFCYDGRLRPPSATRSLDFGEALDIFMSRVVASLESESTLLGCN